jgi:hypothetical protein
VSHILSTLPFLNSNLDCIEISLEQFDGREK